MSKVVPIRRGQTAMPQPGKPFAPAVEMLTKLLAAAKRGEVVGLAYVTALPNGRTRFGYDYARGTAEQVAAGTLALTVRMGRQLDADASSLPDADD